MDGSAALTTYDSNKVTVTNLEKNTEYAYRVGDGTNWTENIYYV